MTPSARLAAAIEILDSLDGTALPADRFLRDWFRKRRYAGSKDRAAVGARVYAVLRHRSSFAWRMGGGDTRRLVIAALLDEGRPAEEIAALFDGSPYGPAPLAAEERAAMSASPPGAPPLSVRGEYPDFLEEELRRRFAGDEHVLLDEMLALQARAAIDLRVNTLKTSRDVVQRALAAEGFAVERTPISPWGLRLDAGEGLSKLSALPLYLEGAFEFQDEASQIAALLCGAAPGMRVLDFAAGAGGKTLALAAAMQNRGVLVAHDSSAARLRQLEPRAARAGARLIRTTTNLSGETFDVVLVDSPCSGSGTWRRQPELRWRLTPDRLRELNALQDQLLAQAAAFVAPGGRLVFATCSLLPCENEDRIDQFLGSHGGFVRLPVREMWGAGSPPPGLGEVFRASPATTGTDGFFTAVLGRR